MHALLSLANTESHNFTAEVLMREAADAWDVNRAALATTRWMQAQGLPMTDCGCGWQRTLTGQPSHQSVDFRAALAHGTTSLAAITRPQWRSPANGERCATSSGTSLQGRFWGKQEPSPVFVRSQGF